ncbi:MAG: sigma-54 dependent transcriptional regulator [Gammaproteobacteria bacterium]|nr:sigma-54 dependent transcriptional regulator [Gammaproteobacteria bacterium]
MMDLSNKIALIVDDEPDILELLAITLERMGLAVDRADSLAAARDCVGIRKPDLCLTDMRLPDGDGLELVEWLQNQHPGLPVAVITAHGNVEAAVQALKLGAFDFVSKPVDLGQLRGMVQTALRLEPTVTPLETASEQQSTLQGNSAAIEDVRRLIAKVARSQAPVHISGESGTGKELTARLIHASSARRDGPFVAVNCGAIPSELMESEFFGHKKGSFTGAHADKEGLFQAAEGGTLFLDEVAELPLHMQVKLLRVIQEKAIRPVGKTHEEDIDVRILSATHRDLAERVAAGAFREDLFYRINVIELHVPALRERPGDIPVLVSSLLRKLANTTGLPEPEVEPAALDKLAGYSFPGNVRELENILERAMTLSSGQRIHADDIKLGQKVARQADPQSTPPPNGHGADVASLPRNLGDEERQAIEAALQATRYNKTKAAEKLGLTLRQLRYRIQKLGIED